MSERTVGDIVRKREPLCLPAEASVRDAARAMVEYDVGVVLIETNQRVEGLVSERDLIREMASGDFSAETMNLRQIMTRDPDTIEAHASIEEALAHMDTGGFRHLPVVDEREHLIGIVSRRDLF